MPAVNNESSAPLAAAPLGEISQGPGAFELFLDRNQKGIAVLAVLLALAGVGIVVYRGVESSHQEAAGAALNKADEIAEYQSVVDSHDGTRAAVSATVLLADSQWNAGRQDDAINTLRQAIGNHEEHPAMPTAKASLAAKLMAQGKSSEAAKIFEELAADPDASYIAPFALISLGDISRATGDLSKATEAYERVKDFPESNFNEMANSRLTTLKTKPPVAIDAPPAPTTPATGELPPSQTPPPGGLEAPGIDKPAQTREIPPLPQPDPAPDSSSSTSPTRPEELPK